MNEEWRPTKYPDYFVSNLGRVKSCKLHRELILKQTLDRYGYLYVGFRVPGNKLTKFKKVHRLVAEAFLNNYSEDLQVNHKDENKTNNCAENLEMCNNQYNCNYGSRKTALAIPILQYSLTGEFIKEWNSSREVEVELSIPHSTINACCKGKTKSHGKIININQAGGYVWKYKQ